MANPRNTLTRAERVAKWNDDWKAGQKFKPVRATGNAARFKWIAAVIASDLPSTTRLVAHTLVLHGKTNGVDIFPATKTIAREARLSERAVCEHIGLLVSRGFLMRQPRGGNTAGSRGFAYLLFVPSALTVDQRSADRGSKSADRRSVGALTDDQRSYP